MFYKSNDIKLIPLTSFEVDYKKVLEWNQNYEVVKYMHARKRYLCIDDIKEFVNDKNNKFRWGIHYKDEFIGIISLQDIDHIDRVGDIAFLIGETQYYGKGIATECGKLVLKHGFYILNLNKISLGCFAKNNGMCIVAERLGMILEGNLKEQVYFKNEYVNIFKFGITRNQYYK
jgi:RimJ/RimL family protein N-acetyltransferase